MIINVQYGSIMFVVLKKKLLFIFLYGPMVNYVMSGNVGHLGYTIGTKITQIVKNHQDHSD
jgi:hypothetical protein